MTSVKIVKLVKIKGNGVNKSNSKEDLHYEYCPWCDCMVPHRYEHLAECSKFIQVYNWTMSINPK